MATLQALTVAGVIALAVLSGAESRAGWCRGNEPCAACVNCGSCFYCGPRNPLGGSCGVKRAMSDRSYLERQRRHREAVEDLRRAWSLRQ